MSTHILHLETSTKVCSVALSKDGQLLAYLDQIADGYIHGEALTLMITNVLQQAELKLQDLQALSYSSGPGSYTGLRIGLSTAKGLCFALGIPLIGLPTHQILFELAKHNADAATANVVAILDARRTEVYLEIFNAQGQTIRPLSCALLDQTPINDYLPALVVGDCLIKAQSFWTVEGLSWNTEQLSARFQVKAAFDAFKEKHFEDLAYCSPIYLKGANGVLL
ncbi:MAG: tRNA (adenosine(37)-N6)-threonylcarbamoyltransferase complex dimerization subunit type 1 TsaB [Flavobacteriales bacterium]